MDDDELHDEIYAYVRNEHGGVPDLDDLPRIWDSMADDLWRETLVLTYIRLSHHERKWWAYDGLKNLFDELLERGEPVSDRVMIPLQTWVNAAFTDDIERPPKSKRSEDHRDYRISHMYAFLARKGWSWSNVEKTIKHALSKDMDEDTVRSVFRKLNIRDRVFGDAAR